MRQPIRDREAETGALSGLGLELHELIENAREVFRGDATATVGNADADAAIPGRFTAHANRVPAPVLGGIGEEVEQDLPHSARVGSNWSEGVVAVDRDLGSR